MSDSAVLLLLAIALLTMLVYRLGRRRIAALAKGYSAALEGAIKPTDIEYTNIGGLVGYHVVYQVGDPDLKEVKATFTFLPRHSLFFYPLSKIFLRHDRMFVLFFSKNDFTSEGHLMEKNLARSSRHRVIGGNAMSVTPHRHAGREYLVYATNPQVAAILIKILTELPPGLPRHLALYPGNNSFYAFLRPSSSSIEQGVITLKKRFCDFLQRQY